MADNRKYYYLKLKENFFDSDSIVLLEDMKDGILYSNILLKLYLKSLKNGGKLQLDENIPYTAQMIATLTRQQVGTVERALGIFQQLGLVEQLHGGLLYMTDIELMKKLGMLIVQDQVWGRVTANRSSGKSTRYYMDEMHLLLKEEQTAAYSVEIWKRFRKWGGIPTGLTQNVKDLLSSREVENIFENSDMIIMLNQAAGDRQILAKQLNISPHQLSYVTHSGEGEGLLFFGNVILPFVDHFPKDLELYRILTTKLNEISEGAQK